MLCLILMVIKIAHHILNKVHTHLSILEMLDSSHCRSQYDSVCYWFELDLMLLEFFPCISILVFFVGASCLLVFALYLLPLSLNIKWMYD